MMVQIHSQACFVNRLKLLPETPGLCDREIGEAGASKLMLTGSRRFSCKDNDVARDQPIAFGMVCLGNGLL